MAFAALLACVLALGAPAVALAGRAWLTPTKLNGGPSAGSARVAVDPAGDAVAVWLNQAGAHPVIEASSRPAGGAWSAAVTLSNTSEEAVEPQVAIAPGGSTVALWERVSGGVRMLEAATGSALSASWQPRQEVPAPSSAMPLLARVTIDGAGDAVAIWERQVVAKGIVEASFRLHGAGPWGSARTLSETGEYMHPPQVAIDAEGLAVAVWEDNQGTAEPEIWGARKPAGGATWQKAARVSPAAEIVPHNANEPQLAMDARGDAVAVWERFNEVEEIEAASMPAGTEAWRAPVKISTRVGKEGKAEPGNQQVAIDAQGRAVVVWLRETVNLIEASAQNGDGSWQTPAVISATGVTPSEPVLAVDAGGNATAAWVQASGGKALLAASSRPSPGGEWSALAQVPAETEAKEPAIGMDDQGDALASWTRYTGTYAVEASAYDAAGPLLNGLSIPTSATVGQALSFSVSPFDVWSALGATTWSFGDGATATGTSVSHAYTTPGSYTVTVTGTDALGNATSATGTVTVAGSIVSPCLCALAVPKPTILSLSQSRSRWREGGHLASLARKHSLPVGTVFSFALNTPATVTFAFTKPASGRRVGKRCVALTHGNRHKPKCTRTVLKGSIVLPAHTGARTLSFQGRVSASNRLAPGTYTLRLTAANPAGVSPARTLTFTIGR